MGKLFRKSMAIFTLGLLLIATLAGCSSQPEASKNTQTAGQTNFPTKPIQILCVHKAGASTDIVARTLQSY
jgi:tripartite-type tricarboxylate transporter receptor subunit TctC